MRKWKAAVYGCAIALALPSWPAVAGGFGFRMASRPMHMGFSRIVPPFTSFHSGIVPPFTSFDTPFFRKFGRRFPFFGQGAGFFGQGAGVSVPFWFGDWFDNGFGNGALQAGSTPMYIINPAVPPPPPVVYNPPTVETTPAGVEVVRLMSTSPARP